MMNTTRTPKLVLSVSGLVLAVVGGLLLFAPAVLHASNGVELGNDPSLLSDVRAPGGALLALGSVIVAGAFVPWLALPAAMISATVYLAYGFSRLLSIVLDGMPAPGLVYAAGIELVFGAAGAVLFARMRQGARLSPPGPPPVPPPQSAR